MYNFRLFPGIDFTKINLDWIMRKIGLLEKGQTEVDEAVEQAQAAAEEATAAAEQATEAAESAVEQITAVVETANEAKQIAQTANANASTALSTAQGIDAKATQALAAANDALDSVLDFTVSGSLTLTMPAGLEAIVNSLRYAISSDGRFVKVYGFLRFRTTDTQTASVVRHISFTLPEIAETPDSDLTVYNIGYALAGTVVDLTPISNLRYFIAGNNCYALYRANRTNTLNVVTKPDASIYEFHLAPCIYQLKNFGDTPTP